MLKAVRSLEGTRFRKALTRTTRDAEQMFFVIVSVTCRIPSFVVRVEHMLGLCVSSLIPVFQRAICTERDDI